MIDKDGRPVCGSCGAVYQEWVHPLVYVEDAARAAGWRLYVGTTQGGAHLDDALCPGCGKPDPALVRLCRELGSGSSASAS